MYVSSRCIAQKASFVQVVVFVVECVLVRLLVCRGNKASIVEEKSTSRKHKDCRIGSVGGATAPPTFAKVYFN